MSNNGRIATLDVLRGVAVLGILAMNILDFALPPAAYSNPLAYGEASSRDLLSWTLSFVVFDGKMRGLFSFLFGASMLLVIERADARGEPSAAIHFRRMLWLGVIGLGHYLLVWRGDILFEYAVAGAAAWFFHQLETERLVRWGLGFLLLYFALQALSSLGHFVGAVSAPLATPEATAGFVTHYRGGYAEIVTHRLQSRAASPFDAILPYGWEALGYMLLGMAALKSRFLTGGWSAACYRRAAAWGLGIALPLHLALAALLLAKGFPAAWVTAVHEAVAVLVRPVMVFGLAAAIILLARGGSGSLVRRLAAAGRVAFTNYLATSIVMTSLFYGYGLGLYGRLERAELWLVVLPAWALMLSWPRPWLARFRYGPLEWLWRSLARGAAQPMRGPAAGTG